MASNEAHYERGLDYLVENILGESHQHNLTDGVRFYHPVALDELDAGRAADRREDGMRDFNGFIGRFHWASQTDVAGLGRLVADGLDEESQWEAYQQWFESTAPIEIEVEYTYSSGGDPNDKSIRARSIVEALDRACAAVRAEWRENDYRYLKPGMSVDELVSVRRSEARAICEIAITCPKRPPSISRAASSAGSENRRDSLPARSGRAPEPPSNPRTQGGSGAELAAGAVGGIIGLIVMPIVGVTLWVVTTAITLFTLPFIALAGIVGALVSSRRK